MSNLIDTLKGPMANRGLLEDALDIVQNAINELDHDGKQIIEKQEYVTLVQAAGLLALALELK